MSKYSWAQFHDQVHQFRSVWYMIQFFYFIARYDLLSLTWKFYFHLYRMLKLDKSHELCIPAFWIVLVAAAIVSPENEEHLLQNQSLKN